jgi:hypothetical protein
VAAREGIARAKSDPDVAMAALGRRQGTVDLAAHQERMLGTLQLEMEHADIGRLGVGVPDEARLGRSRGQLARARLAEGPDGQRRFQHGLLAGRTTGPGFAPGLILGLRRSRCLR